MRNFRRGYRRAAAIAGDIGRQSAGWRRLSARKPIRRRRSGSFVPFGAGGATDVVARVFADRLTQRMGQSFTVENRGGAAGQIAAAAFARAPADGYDADVHHRRADHRCAADE